MKKIRKVFSCGVPVTYTSDKERGQSSPSGRGTADEDFPCNFRRAREQLLLFHKIYGYYKKHGWRLTWRKLLFRTPPQFGDYSAWQEQHKITEAQIRIQNAYQPKEPFIISIAVPTFQTPEKYLKEMIHSVQVQSYENWELCIADGSPDENVMRILEEYAQKDPRIRVKRLSENKGIAENTNAALEMCTGAYIGLLDHDDTLAVNALYEVAKAIEKERPDAVYTDEDKMSADGQEYFEPHFKPDLNMELLYSNNYICHFFVVRTEIARNVGGFRKAYDGAQDYDFILRCLRESQNVRHIALPLYHWRTHASSTAENPQSKQFAYESGRRAIADHLKQRKEQADIRMTEYPGFYHVRYQVRKKSPVTIVVIHTQGKKGRRQMYQCLRSISATAGYSNYNILVVKSLSQLRKERIRGEYMVLLDSTVTVLKKGWLLEMLADVQREEVGAVGAKLYRKNESIYHAGIIAGMSGYAFEGFPRVANGYFHRDSLMQEMYAVTKDFLMISREDYFAAITEEFVKPGDELALCDALRKKGKKVIFNPELEAYTEKKRSVRAKKGSGMVQSEEKDPYYNENLSLEAPGFCIR